jgi:hypothetical protein
MTGAHGVTGDAYANGGTGGRAYGTGTGGAGGAASATATGSSSTTAALNVNAYSRATGGAGGGNFTSSGDGGAGGAALQSSATATETSATGGRALATATSTGGTGGRGAGSGNHAGAGGTNSGTRATASGFNAWARAYQSGGAGGRGYGGAAGGAGAASTLTNAVSGTANGGYLRLRQNSTGGAGGYAASGGVSGAGGAGTSSLTVTDTKASSLIAYVTGIGGSGGTSPSVGGVGGAGTGTLTLTGLTAVSGSVTATGGAGGGGGAAGGVANATGTVTATSTGATGTATVTATATGGMGSTQAAANATPTAVTAAGQQAQATATATGSGGFAKATSTTAGTGIVTSLSSVAQDPVTTLSSNAQSLANGVNPYGFNGSANNAYAFGTLAPNASFISSVLAANSNIGAASTPGMIKGLGSSFSAVFGAAVEGNFNPGTASGSHEYISSQNFTLNGSIISGHLIVGLIGDQVIGSVSDTGDFTSLKFSVVVGGVTTVTDTFTSLSAANTFFTNHAVDAGTFTSSAGLLVTVKLDLTTSTAGFGFGQSLVLGSTDGFAPPVLTAPSQLELAANQSTAISGVSVSEATALSAGQTVTVNLADAHGLLSQTAGQGVVTGNGTVSLTLTGTVAQVNADLATLSVKNATPSGDTITLTSSDSRTGDYSKKIQVGQLFTFTAGVDTFTGGVGNDLLVAAANTLSAGDNADGGTGTNTLQLNGGGTFNLSLPTTLKNIQLVNATEGAGAAKPTITLRSGLNVTLTMANGGAGAGATITGAADSSTVKLGSGTDTVTVGAATETIDGGAGVDTINVTPTTIGATINGGTNASTELVLTTGGVATMGSGITNIHTVQLTAATTFTANALSGLTVKGSTGNDTITAGGAGQILIGGGGTDTLIGATAGGDTFRDTGAHLNGATVQKFFEPGDIIDITDLSSVGATESFSAGVLTVRNGATSVAIKLTGTFMTSDFSLASDGKTGVDVTQTGGTLTTPGAFAQAMAGFAPGRSMAALVESQRFEPKLQPVLAAPGHGAIA